MTKAGWFTGYSIVSSCYSDVLFRFLFLMFERGSSTSWVWQHSSSKTSLMLDLCEETGTLISIAFSSCTLWQVN